MKQKLETMITHDLGIQVSEIRKASWNDLERIKRIKKRDLYQPEGMFVVGGNINLAQGKEMDIKDLRLSTMVRRGVYFLKCLRNHKNRE